MVTDVPVTRPGAPEAPPFDVFTPLHRSEQGGAAAPGTGDAPYPQSYADPRTGTSDPQPSYGPGYGQPAAGQPGVRRREHPRRRPGCPAGGPRRQRRHGLQGAAAPRAAGQPRTAASRLHRGGLAGTAGASVPPAAAASLTDMRNTLSAMQRGWQQGRSQTQRDTEGGADGN